MHHQPILFFCHSEACAIVQLHEKIKLIRTVKGWSQEEVAERLSMSVNGYANIERGDTDIHLSRLEQIARIFEMELAELFGMN